MKISRRKQEVHAFASEAIGAFSADSRLDYL
jgi:hypothetical protein